MLSTDYITWWRSLSCCTKNLQKINRQLLHRQRQCKRWTLYIFILQNVLKNLVVEIYVFNYKASVFFLHFKSVTYLRLNVGRSLSIQPELYLKGNSTEGRVIYDESGALCTSPQPASRDKRWCIGVGKRWVKKAQRLCPWKKFLQVLIAVVR